MNSVCIYTLHVDAAVLLVRYVLFLLLLQVFAIWVSVCTVQILK